MISRHDKKAYTKKVTEQAFARLSASGMNLTKTPWLYLSRSARRRLALQCYGTQTLLQTMTYKEFKKKYMKHASSRKMVIMLPDSIRQECLDNLMFGQLFYLSDTRDVSFKMMDNLKEFMLEKEKLENRSGLPGVVVQPEVCKDIIPPMGTMSFSTWSRARENDRERLLESAAYADRIMALYSKDDGSPANIYNL